MPQYLPPGTTPWPTHRAKARVQRRRRISDLKRARQAAGR